MHRRKKFKDYYLNEGILDIAKSVKDKAVDFFTSDAAKNTGKNIAKGAKASAIGIKHGLSTAVKNVSEEAAKNSTESIMQAKKEGKGFLGTAKSGLMGHFKGIGKGIRKSLKELKDKVLSKLDSGKTLFILLYTLTKYCNNDKVKKDIFDRCKITNEKFLQYDELVKAYFSDPENLEHARKILPNEIFKKIENDISTQNQSISESIEILNESLIGLALTGLSIASCMYFFQMSIFSLVTMFGPQVIRNFIEPKVRNERIIKILEMVIKMLEGARIITLSNFALTSIFSGSWITGSIASLFAVNMFGKKTGLFSLGDKILRFNKSTLTTDEENVIKGNINYVICNIEDNKNIFICKNAQQSFDYVSYINEFHNKNENKILEIINNSKDNIIGFNIGIQDTATILGLIDKSTKNALLIIIQKDEIDRIFKSYTRALQLICLSLKIDNSDNTLKINKEIDSGKLIKKLINEPKNNEISEIYSKFGFDLDIGLYWDESSFKLSGANPDNPLNYPINIKNLPANPSFEENGSIIINGTKIELTKSSNTKDDYTYEAQEIKNINSNDTSKSSSIMGTISNFIGFDVNDVKKAIKNLDMDDVKTGGIGAISGATIATLASQFCDMNPMIGSILRPIISNPKTSGAIIGTLLALGLKPIAKKLINFVKSKINGGKE